MNGDIKKMTDEERIEYWSACYRRMAARNQEQEAEIDRLKDEIRYLRMERQSPIIKPV